ncbi:MAG TPA: helicase C-terminal domain-containing protein [Candidatus Saccharimonadales bacterium]|nr:helicase C-terminal domain-containing protein [Candidatus Saccharimonadales bacterium]
MTIGPAHPDHLVAFDLETTGLSPRSDRILEIGAVRYDENLQRIDQLQLIVDPQIPIPLAIQRLCGLTDADVLGAPPPLEAATQLAGFCGDAALIAHGGTFDLLFLRSLLTESFGARLIFDTLDLARILLPTFESHSLPLLSRRLGIPHERPHRALSDALATGDLFRMLVGAGRRLPESTQDEMRRVAAQAPGALDEFLNDVMRRRGVEVEGPSEPAPSVATPPVAAPTRHSVASLATRNVGDAAAALLGPDGPLAVRDGYEYREAQQQMAVAVGQTLERKRRLMVEAGTGIGKSLAYLTPLAIWAARTGKRAVVATHTVNLQEQLADRDLPTVAGLLEQPVPVAVLKGRNHYISLRRWRRFLDTTDVNAQGPDLSAIRFKLKILAWLVTTSTGDRSEVYLSGEEEQLWRRIASEVTDCLGPACANWANAHCHMVSARRGAADAAIVVTNHALLLAANESQGQILGPYEALVVDEAHHLEAVATEQLGLAVRLSDITLVLDRVPAMPGAPLGIELERCREAGQRLFGDAKAFMAARLGGEHAANGRVGLSDAVREDPGFALLERSAMHAIGVLQRTASALASAPGGVQIELLPQPDRAGDELEHASAALAGLAAAIDCVIVRPRLGTVAWIEMRREQAELHEAPIDVSVPLAESVFNPAESVVLTSATLSVAGGFDFVRTRVGIGAAADELTLPSPFDYLRQAICILPENATAYDDPIHDAQMAELVDGIAGRLDGHTLVLFTSYGPLKRVWSLLQDRLDARGIASLAQGLDGTRRQILQSFLADPRTVLLATSSFWEGVDIPGDRLRCVIIDKLPFPVPTDPLVRARSEQLRDPFGEYVLPVAIIRLRQGFGRLIRSASDRGAVVLCDPRLRTRQYGRGFLSALPPAPRAVSGLAAVPAMVDAFVNRGALPETMGESNRWSSNDLDPA